MPISCLGRGQCHRKLLGFNIRRSSRLHALSLSLMKHLLLQHRPDRLCSHEFQHAIALPRTFTNGISEDLALYVTGRVRC